MRGVGVFGAIFGKGGRKVKGWVDRSLSPQTPLLLFEGGIDRLERLVAIPTSQQVVMPLHRRPIRQPPSGDHGREQSGFSRALPLVNRGDRCHNRRCA